MELEKLEALTKAEEQRKWLKTTAVPTTKMRPLSHLLEEAGHENISLWTDRALLLHEYQYHGPDPDMALFRYTTRAEAADIIMTAREVMRRVETHKNRLWSNDLEKALKE